MNAKLSSLKTITGKEFRAYVDHPTAYLLLIVFAVINGFFFFRSSYLVNVATLRPMFDLMIFLFLFFIPAITMRLIAEERRNRTLEGLLSQPVNETQVLLGKFFASVLFVAVGLVLTLPIPLLLQYFGSFDFGMVASQYIGSLLLCSAMTALGLFASSLTKNQVTAFILSIALLFVFILLGYDMVLGSLPSSLKVIAEQLSLTWHFNNMARGVLDLRDLIYFITVTAAFLFLSYWFIVRDRINPHRPIWRRLRFGMALGIAAIVIVNLLGLNIHGRLDFTKNRIYTLSPATKDLVRSLPDPVTLTLYRSSEIPGEITTTVRDVQDLLVDLEGAGEGKIRVVNRIIGAADLETAASEGIQPVQFNVVKSDEFQVKQGVFGMSLSYLDQKELMPFIQRSDDVEYQTISLIRKMTKEKKESVAFLDGHGEKAQFSDLSNFSEGLTDQYDVETLTFNENDKKYSSVPDVLVIAGPKEEMKTEEKEALKGYLSGGGRVLWLVDAIDVNVQTLSTTENKNSLGDLLKEFGVSVEANMIGDLRSNESVTFGGGQFNLVLPYPLWVRAQSDRQHLITSSIEGVVMPWPSSLKLNDGIKASTLFKTTSFGFSQSGSFVIQPDEDFSKFLSGKEPRLLAVALAPEGEASGPRMVVVGDSDFLTNSYAESNQENILFGRNAIDWLAQDEQLIALRSKQRQASPLVFDNASQKNMVKYANLAGIPILIALAGALRIGLRRRKIKQSL